MASRRAGIAAVIVAMGLVALWDPASAAPAPGPGIPATVFGVLGDGGLPLEQDLAVGRASVAIANSSAVFVVSANDGAYHRVRLPGYDAGLYDSGAPGLALSPDGTKLAYAWHGRRPPPGDYWIPSGVRVADLTTGEVQQGPVPGPGSGRVTRLGRLTWNLNWSPDGRYIAFNEPQVVSGFPRNWFGPGLTVSAHLLDTTTYEEVIDTGDYSGPVPPMATTAGQLVLVDDGRLVTWDGAVRRRGQEVAEFVAGRISPDGGFVAMTGGDSLGLVLLSVAGRTGSAVLSNGEGGAFDLLGWTGPDRLLGVLHRQAGPSDSGYFGGADSGVRRAVRSRPADAALVQLTLTRSVQEGSRNDFRRTPRVRTRVVGTVTGGDPGSVFSFATDLAATEPVTRDFEPPPFAGGTQAGPAAARAPKTSNPAAADESGVPLETALVTVALAVIAVVGIVVVAAGWTRTGSRTRRVRPRRRGAAHTGERR